MGKRKPARTGIPRRRTRVLCEVKERGWGVVMRCPNDKPGFVYETNVYSVLLRKVRAVIAVTIRNCWSPKYDSYSVEPIACKTTWYATGG